jgi:hypothetical protein
MGRGLWRLGLGLGSYCLRARSWRRGFFPSFTPDNEEEAPSLKSMLSSIERRLGELEKQRRKD